MNYVPRLDDYVKWKTIEGWIYFIDSEYLTIEISTKNKDENDIANCPIHKKTHCLVVCYPQYWCELNYIKNRRQSDNS